jgi:phosphatidyl-myo-inositol dimannoside synthase
MGNNTVLPGFDGGRAVIGDRAPARHRAVAALAKPARPGRVLLLAPSSGLGGGIERYLDGVQQALLAGGAACQRLDLTRPGLAGQAGLLVRGRAALRSGSGPARLIVGHRCLLPVAAMLARDRAVRGVSVLAHGSEVWSGRSAPWARVERWLMRRPGIRVVAVSGFTAGTLIHGRPAVVLPPALPSRWFGTLAAARAGAAAARALAGTSGQVVVVTAFRLTDWRGKGLPELVAAIAALDRPDVCLRVCGSGEPPPGLVALTRRYPWCVLRPGLSDGDLAAELAGADLFVLATRTRSGRHPSGEGFGLVLIEAQLAGTPVVAPAYGGSHDAYLEGVTGTAPADESAAALAGVLRWMLADRARLAAMGSRAAAWAGEAFAPDGYPDRVARKLL